MSTQNEYSWLCTLINVRARWVSCGRLLGRSLGEFYFTHWAARSSVNCRTLNYSYRLVRHWASSFSLVGPVRPDLAVNLLGRPAKEQPDRVLPMKTNSAIEVSSQLRVNTTEYMRNCTYRNCSYYCPVLDTTDLYIGLDAVPPIHIVSNHEATDKVTTQYVVETSVSSVNAFV